MSIIVYVVLALAVMGGIGVGVHKVKKWGGDEVRAEWNQANEKARAAEAEKSAAAAKALAEALAKRKVITREVIRHVDREIEKPVYRDVCLPPTGVCLANAAINGTVPAGCFSDGAVPSPKPPG